MKRRFILSGAISLVVVFLATTAIAQQYDLAALAKFRADRVTTLTADNGWFTVAGLHFLNQGENRVGSDPSNDIVLDFPSVPRHAAVITLDGTRVRIKAASGQTLVINDQPVVESELHGAFDNAKVTDTIRFDNISFFVHYSGPRLAVRVRDQKSPLRQHFSGLKWFDADPAYRVIGTFTPLPEPKTVEMPNILGDLEPFTIVGSVSLSLGGVDHTMQAWRSGERLWFVFRDQTSGRETNPSQRFLYTGAPVDGKVVMDFNYAQNPPCAYNPYTTCPLPPKQNRLSVAVRAGEKKYSVGS